MQVALAPGPAPPCSGQTCLLTPCLVWHTERLSSVIGSLCPFHGLPQPHHTSLRPSDGPSSGSRAPGGSECWDDWGLDGQAPRLADPSHRTPCSLLLQSPRLPDQVRLLQCRHQPHRRDQQDGPESLHPALHRALPAPRPAAVSAAARPGLPPCPSTALDPLAPLSQLLSLPTTR